MASKTWADNGGQAQLPTSRLISRLPSRKARKYARGPAAPWPAPPPTVSLPERPLPPPGPNSPTLLSGDESPAERKIREALSQPTQVEFVETPLKDVIDYLKDLHHIEIQLDAPALKEAGVDESTPVTKNLKGISLRSA